MEKHLSELVEKLTGASGANLKSVLLYGSAAGGEFQKKFSDVNVLCILGRLDAAELQKLNAVAVWWGRKGYAAPMVFTQDELTRSADIFAIELLDIKARHRVLHGEDIVAAIDVPMGLHRVQVERELRTHMVRLRQGYLAMPGDHKAVLALMTSSISSFATLFRHALLAMGEQPPVHKREAVTRLAELLGFDASAFHAIYEVRKGQRKPAQLDIPATFHAYLNGVGCVADEVDRRLAT